ncbi:hypothetical protein GOV03_01855 [Candidatus Woesearchaeota archaeon]|nr:hypothetical protein [Candidatus Woesearchaeota archaeon]
MALTPFGLMGMGSFVVAWFVGMIAIYIYFAFALMTIAKKTKTDNAWLAWIPIANVYLMTKMAGLPGWLTLAVLLPLIPLMGNLALMAVLVFMWWKIAEAIKKPGWWGVLLIVPLVNLVVVGVMAWGK